MPFKRIFYYFWQLTRQYKIAFFSQFFFMSGRVVFSNVIIGYIYKNIIDTLNNTTLSIETRYKLSIFFLVSLGTSFATSMVMSRYADFILFRFISRMIKDIYDFSFQELSMHSYNFYINSFVGSIVARVKRFARAFDIINESLSNFWLIILTIMGSSLVLYFESKKLALYFLSWSIVYFIFVILFIKQKITYDLKEAEADSKVTGVLSDVFTNIINVKIFSSFKQEFEYFKSVTTLVKDTIWKSMRFSSIRHVFQASMMILFHVFILYTMLNFWRSGEITVGVLVMAYAYMIFVFDRIWDLSSILARFMKAITDTKEIVDIFDKTPDILDVKNPEKCLISKGEIEFQEVNFEYLQDFVVFKNFNLKIYPGERVGLVGHSGSGKSTIVRMLLRFVDIKDGEILIDRQNVAKIKQDDLRSKISYVPQEPILFHRSIRENIAYSRPGASEEEIVEVAKRAHAHEFIENLPYGYDTLVGERGVKLSGGERQRVAIARAMLKNAPILVLDEATSSLDSVSESYIQDAFNELMKGRSTIVIAHRLSTIQKMDRIIVLEQGKIVEEGTHKELLAKNGVYKDLWDHQTGGFLE
ncbi:MAG: ABC transporter ATP-binding protein [Patescibacteria group bacterium]